jgi:hypothetical protein
MLQLLSTAFQELQRAQLRKEGTLTQHYAQTAHIREDVIWDSRRSDTYPQSRVHYRWQDCENVRNRATQTRHWWEDDEPNNHSSAHHDGTTVNRGGGLPFRRSCEKLRIDTGRCLRCTALPYFPAEEEGKSLTLCHILFQNLNCAWCQGQRSALAWTWYSRSGKRPSLNLVFKVREAP